MKQTVRFTLWVDVDTEDDVSWDWQEALADKPGFVAFEYRDTVKNIV